MNSLASESSKGKIRHRGTSKEKASWKTDIELDDFRNLIRERADKLLEETRLPRLIWMAFAIGAFLVAIVIILVGIQGEDMTITSAGTAMTLLLGLPVIQLRRIQSDVGKVISLPVSVEVRLRKCGWKSRGREDYRMCLVGVMDEVDALFRIWSKDPRTTGGQVSE